MSFELMHCVSTYPMDDKNANLKTIDTLKKSLSAMLDTADMKLGPHVSCGLQLLELLL